VSNNRNTLIRSMHDVGLAAWFGGSLMGAVGLNGSSQDIENPADRTRVAAAGWARWTPVAATSIGAHLIGGAGLVLAHRDRVRHQSGVTANTVVKTALTVSALATTAYSGMLGAKLAAAGQQTSDGATKPNSQTPTPIVKIQQQQRILQWITPALTGVLIVLGAQQGEQQRPGERLRGVRDKIAQQGSDVLSGLGR
jgi:hypothetical protein